jgi:hypothetical protein
MFSVTALIEILTAVMFSVTAVIKTLTAVIFSVTAVIEIQTAVMFSVTAVIKILTTVMFSVTAVIELLLRLSMLKCLGSLFKKVLDTFFVSLSLHKKHSNGRDWLYWLVRADCAEVQLYKM